MLPSTRPGPRHLVALVLLAVLSAACGGGGSEPETRQTPKTEDITLASLGLDDWKAADELSVEDPPPVPAGFDAARYDGLVTELKLWGKASTISAGVRESKDARSEVSRILGSEVGEAFRRVSGKSESKQMAAASVFDPAVTVIGQPVVEAGWDLGREVDDVSGVKLLALTLQTRAAYRVRLEDGAERVIAVLRNHTVKIGPENTRGMKLGYLWQTFGNDECTLAEKDRLLPSADLAEAKEDLAKFVRTSAAAEGVAEFVDGTRIDEDVRERCRTAAS